MKKFLLILLFIALVGISIKSFAQINPSIDYFPLKVGNVWVYRCSAYGIPPSCVCIVRKYRFTVTGTIVRNNKTYFLFEMTQTSYTCNTCYAPYLLDTIRVDSSSGNIYKYSLVNGCSYSPFEIMFDSLNARLNDTVSNNCVLSQSSYRCTDTSYQNILGTMRKTKSFNASLFESGYGRAFAKGIGLISAGMTYVFCNQNGSTLIGCVLDGVLYGDTSMLVGITQISSEVPHKFDLYQNYPNPFNPTTSIRFSIPSLVRRGEGVVVLKVYDVLGSEIQTLVNENLSPGTYEVEWVGSKFASGVYYYTLSADDYKETKKMVLMK